MPNMVKMEKCYARIEEIDAAIRTTKHFLDKKTYINTEQGGRELMTLSQLEELRDKETAKLREAGME